MGWVQPGIHWKGAFDGEALLRIYENFPEAARECWARLHATARLQSYHDAVINFEERGSVGDLLVADGGDAVNQKKENFKF